jgi:hypothetical protein
VTLTETPAVDGSAPEQPDDLPKGAIRHGECGRWWTGINRAHCAADGCHRTFSGDSAAEKHRVGSFGSDGDRRCVDPATVGLVARDMPYGVLWGWPGPDEDKAALLAELRAAS